MSYSILYRSMFVKVADDRFIPLYESGDNNVWECDMKRRAREWGHCYFSNGRNDRNELPFFTEHEILKMTEDGVEHSVYCGTKVSGRSCTDEKDLMNYWRRAIKRAKTLEELTEADIKLQVKDLNSYYDKDALHFSKAVNNLEELIIAWSVCIATCGTAEVVPLYDVSEWKYKRLYPKKPKVVKQHDEGYVVTINGYLIMKATPRHFRYCYDLCYAHVYTTRATAEKLQKRIQRSNYTSEIIPVRKNENNRWEKAA